jgi:hypothetical protein
MSINAYHYVGPYFLCTFEGEEAPCKFDISEELKEHLSQVGEVNGFVYWIGNIEILKRDTELQWDSIFNIESSDVETEKGIFESFHKENIEILEKHYAKVELKWGVVSYEM